MRASAGTVLREWGRLGCIGFGGPPTHIALLRDLCVTRRAWLSDREFEDAIAACNLLPGPASTQLSIFCAWRVRGALGAVVGGLGFVVPGLVAMLALAAIFLASSPPDWIRGAGAGGGAAVAAVAVHAGASLVPGSYGRVSGGARRRWVVYLALGVLAAATVGPWLVLLLVVCGAVEVGLRRAGGGRGGGGGGGGGGGAGAAGEASRRVTRGRRCSRLPRRRRAASARSHGSRSRSARSRTAAGS